MNILNNVSHHFMLFNGFYNSLVISSNKIPIKINVPTNQT